MQAADFARHFIAFIDVIGFANIVYSAALRKEKTAIEKINCYVKESRRIVDSLSKRDKMEKMQIDIVSDSIILSLPVQDESRVLEKIQKMCVAVAQIQKNLAHSNIWTRGAISVGNLARLNQVMIGDAFIRAYEMEKRHAVWPRVIIDPGIIQFFRSRTDFIAQTNKHPFKDWKGSLIFEHQTEIHSPLEEDFLFVDYLMPFLCDDTQGENFQIILDNLRSNLCSDPQYFPKHLQIANYLKAHLGQSTNSRRYCAECIDKFADEIFQL